MGIALMMDFLLGKLWGLVFHARDDGHSLKKLPGLVFHADDDRLSTRKTKIICLSLGL